MRTASGITRLAQAVAVGLLLCQACADQTPQTPRATPSAQVEGDDDVPATEEPVAPMAAYSPIGKRDPFSAPILPGSRYLAGTSAPTRLQTFDLDQLRVGFTNTATSSPLAVILDPTGHGYDVHIGDYAGKNWGRIASIKTEAVTVRETLVDADGTEHPQDHTLQMQGSGSASPGQDYDLHLSDSASDQN